MRYRIGLTALVAVGAMVTNTQAAVLYSQSVNVGAGNSYNAFGMVQSQTGGNAAQLWNVFIDNVTYTTASGTKTQQFDSAASASAAGWTANVDATTAPNNFSYSPTNNSGGALGEGGGTISRGAGGRGYYSDTTVGTIDMTQDLHAHGRLWIDGAAANNAWYLGWIDTGAGLSEPARLGFSFTENSASPPDGGRINVQKIGASDDSGTVSDVHGIAQMPLFFSLTYVAATGTLTGVIATIPEPSSLVLLTIGMAGVSRRARKTPKRS